MREMYRERLRERIFLMSSH
uniref:Uncharacterized protein n=1 Tax=Rhizophora mucronata TaxID=61149 RepID=A0A2P2IJA2_RHIMU